MRRRNQSRIQRKDGDYWPMIGCHFTIQHTPKFQLPCTRRSSKDEVYFVTSLPDKSWALESYSEIGDINTVREAFSDFHDEVKEVLRACPAVLRWAILEREPLRHWSSGSIVLIGDAAHPMTPYMAQGAAMAMEDGVILARAFEQEANIETALSVFESSRKTRTAKVQAISHDNTWMREDTDPTWCYGFDPWIDPLAT